MFSASSSALTSTAPIVARLPHVADCAPNWHQQRTREGPLFHVRMQRELGDAIEFATGAISNAQISHPDDIERVLRASHREFHKGIAWTSFRVLVGDGLITTEVARWQKHRRDLQPPFMRQHHERFAQRVSQTVDETAAQWRARDGETLHVTTEMSRLTLHNAAHTLFGTDWMGEVAAISERLARALQYLSKWYEYPVHKRVLGTYVSRTIHAQFRRDMNALENVVRNLVKRRETVRRIGEEPDDLLKQLFDVAQTRGFNRWQRARFLRDNIFTFIFTGHETTAICAAWTWHLLAQNPDAEAQLHAELHRVLDGRTPTRADLPQLPFLRQIILESLRLYPPVWLFLRQTSQPEEIGGYTLPTNSVLSIYPFVTHRHRDFWDAPDEFQPERFAPDKLKSQHPFAYFPFGGGPRTCLGRQTALAEAQIVIAGLAQHFRLRAVPDVEIRAIDTMTLLPSHDLPMILQKR